MAAPEQAPPQGGGNILTQRLGPLATWVWLLILTVVIGALVLWQQHKAGTTATAAQATAGQVTGAQNVPDFIVQNTINNPADTDTAPPSTTPPPKPPGPPAKKPPKPGSKPPDPGEGKHDNDFKTVTVARWTKKNAPWSSTLDGIADHYKVPIAQLMKLNGIKHATQIHAGQKIRVPV